MPKEIRARLLMDAERFLLESRLEKRELHPSSACDRAAGIGLGLNPVGIGSWIAGEQRCLTEGESQTIPNGKMPTKGHSQEDLPAGSPGGGASGAHGISMERDGIPVAPSSRWE